MRTAIYYICHPIHIIAGDQQTITTMEISYRMKGRITLIDQTKLEPTMGQIMLLTDM